MSAAVSALTTVAIVSANSHSSGGAALGAAIFQLVGIVAVLVWMATQSFRDDRETARRRKADEERVQKLRAQRLVEQPWLKEPRMNMDDYHLSL